MRAICFLSAKGRNTTTASTPKTPEICDAHISMPAKQISCPAFGGADLQTLFATSAADGLTGEDEGKTFFAEVKVRGQSEHKVVL